MCDIEITSVLKVSIQTMYKCIDDLKDFECTYWFMLGLLQFYDDSSNSLSLSLNRVMFGF